MALLAEDAAASGAVSVRVLCDVGVFIGEIVFGVATSAAITVDSRNTLK